jgi:hypothetical protein
MIFEPNNLLHHSGIIKKPLAWIKKLVMNNTL